MGINYDWKCRAVPIRLMKMQTKIIDIFHWIQDFSIVLIKLLALRMIILCIILKILQSVIKVPYFLQLRRYRISEP